MSKSRQRRRLDAAGYSAYGAAPNLPRCRDCWHAGARQERPGQPAAHECTLHRAMVVWCGRCGEWREADGTKGNTTGVM